MNKHNHISLFVDDTWVKDFNTLTQILGSCADASSPLAKEFLEAVLNGLLPAWLRQQGERSMADELSRINAGDDDKVFLDQLKKIILDIDVSDTKRPPLTEQVCLEEALFRTASGQWEKLPEGTPQIKLPPDYRGKCDIRL